MLAVLEEHKARDIVVIDVSKHTVVADDFVIATATSRTHMDALTDALKERLDDAIHHVEGSGRSNWVLIDCRDVIVHLFLAEARAFYGLERLWGDAPAVSVGGDAGR